MIDWDHIEERLAQFDGITVKRNYPLAPLTSYKVGGPAELFVAPETETAVGLALAALHDEGVTPFVLGGGCNVLISDDGWPGTVLYIGNNLSGWSFEDNHASVNAGSVLLDFIRDAVNHGLGGMELMAGIPGGVGGALRMNAGAFGQEIESTVREIYGFGFDGSPVTANRADIDFSYRSAPELMGTVITSAVFEFEQEDPQVLRERMEDVLALRAKKQPLEYPSCGSVFKRPPGYYAGALIEEVGMKGVRHGNAQVSARHAGFIVNLGGATAAEIRELMGMVAEKVQERFGVELQREVKLIGFPGLDE